MAKGNVAAPDGATPSRFPKAYLRIDPDVDFNHPDLDGLVRLLCAANRQSRRGIFDSLALVRSLFGGAKTKKFLDRGDLIPGPEGTVEVPHWRIWQEFNLSVGDRMRVIRAVRAGTPEEEALANLGERTPGAYRTLKWRLRKQVLERDKYTCRYCGEANYERKWLVVDHIIPQPHGPDTLENFATACRPCNKRKGGRTPEEAGMPLRDIVTRHSEAHGPGSDASPPPGGDVTVTRHTSEASGVRRKASDAAIAAENPPNSPPAAGKGPPDVAAGAEPYTPVEVLKCPDCERAAVIRQNPQRSGGGIGWVCFKPQGGCGMVFDVGIPEILDQLPARQIEAVRRSVERMTGGAAAAKGPAVPDLALEAGRRRVGYQIAQAQAEPAAKVWDQALAVLQATIERHAFATWFRPLVCHGLLRDDEGVRLVLEVPNRPFGDWIARNYWRQIEAAFKELQRGDLQVYLVTAKDGESWSLGPTLAEALAAREAAAG